MDITPAPQPREYGRYVAYCSENEYSLLLNASIFLLKFHSRLDTTSEVQIIIDMNFTRRDVPAQEIDERWRQMQNRIRNPVAPGCPGWLKQLQDIPSDHPSVLGACHYLRCHKLRGMLGPFNSAAGYKTYEEQHGIPLYLYDEGDAVRAYRARGGRGEAGAYHGLWVYRRFDWLVRAAGGVYQFP